MVSILPCNSNNLTSVKKNSLSVISFLDKLELICLHTSIAIVSEHLNGFCYCYRTLINLFHIKNLFADSEVVTSIAI